MVTPFHLDAEQMDSLIVRVEDAGISVVDENGDPSELSLKKASHEEKELAKVTYQLHLVLRSMIQFGCTLKKLAVSIS